MLGELVEGVFRVPHRRHVQPLPARGREHLEDELRRHLPEHDSGVGEGFDPRPLDPVQDPLVDEPQTDLAGGSVTAGPLAVGDQLVDGLAIVGLHEPLDQLQDEWVATEHRRQALGQTRLHPEFDEQLRRLARREILQLHLLPHVEHRRDLLRREVRRVGGDGAAGEDDVHLLQLGGVPQLGHPLEHVPNGRHAADGHLLEGVEHDRDRPGRPGQPSAPRRGRAGRRPRNPRRRRC